MSGVFKAMMGGSKAMRNQESLTKKTSLDDICVPLIPRKIGTPNSCSILKDSTWRTQLRLLGA